MAFFPRLSYLSLYGGELHLRGGILMKARLSEWGRELQYLRYRIAEWKEFGSVDHPDYYAFRTFLLQRIRNHLLFELKTLSSILMACEVAARSDEVPPLQNYIDSIFAFRERISPGEITRRIHLEEWHRYSRTKDVETDDTQSEMDDMFAKIRNEIGGMELRIKEFKSMVDELVRMVGAMQEKERLRQGGGGLQLQLRQDGFLIRTTRRHPAQDARTMVRSPSDFLPAPILANSRARLPPLLSPPPPPPSPLSTAHSSSPRRRLPTSSVPRLRQERQQAAASSAAISRTIILPSSPSPPPPPPPPRPARNIHRRFFRRVFHMSQSSDPPSLPRTPSPSRIPGPSRMPSPGRTPGPSRTPSPGRTPSPLGTPPTPPPLPSGPGFGPSASLIAETRARLPPPPEASPIPYRPPGQRRVSFLHRP